MAIITLYQNEIYNYYESVLKVSIGVDPFSDFYGETKFVSRENQKINHDRFLHCLHDKLDCSFDFDGITLVLDTEKNRIKLRRAQYAKEFSGKRTKNKKLISRVIFDYRCSLTICKETGDFYVHTHNKSGKKFIKNVRKNMLDYDVERSLKMLMHDPDSIRILGKNLNLQKCKPIQIPYIYNYIKKNIDYEDTIYVKLIEKLIKKNRKDYYGLGLRGIMAKRFNIHEDSRIIHVIIEKYLVWLTNQNHNIPSTPRIDFGLIDFLSYFDLISEINETIEKQLFHDNKSFSNSLCNLTKTDYSLIEYLGLNRDERINFISGYLTSYTVVTNYMYYTLFYMCGIRLKNPAKQEHVIKTYHSLLKAINIGGYIYPTKKLVKLVNEKFGGYVIKYYTSINNQLTLSLYSELGQHPSISFENPNYGDVVTSNGYDLTKMRLEWFNIIYSKKVFEETMLENFGYEYRETFEYIK